MRLAYSRFGEGNESNVVILHGLLGSKRNWFGIGKSLADLGFHVWLIDLRNHGESEWSDKHTYFDLAEDVKKLLEEQGIVNSVLIGHSMGGKAAMVLDKLYQGFISKLVIVDIAPVTYAPNFENYLKTLNKIYPKEAGTTLYENNKPMCTIYASFNRMIVFDSTLPHSRNMFDNFGEDIHSRLVQVIFIKKDEYYNFT